MMSPADAEALGGSSLDELVKIFLQDNHIVTVADGTFEGMDELQEL
jgi:hypothetical protein